MDTQLRAGELVEGVSRGHRHDQDALTLLALVSPTVPGIYFELPAHIRIADLTALASHAPRRTLLDEVAALLSEAATGTLPLPAQATIVRALLESPVEDLLAQPRLVGDATRRLNTEFRTVAITEGTRQWSHLQVMLDLATATHDLDLA